jgi:hypothetical protein
VAQCRRLYPEYRALSGPALEGMRRNVRYLVGGFFEFNLIEGRSPTMDEMKPAIANAQARVAQGVSLGAMIGTFQLALPILWEHLIEAVAEHPGVHLEVLRRVPVTFASVNRVTTLATEVYLAERERLLRSRGEAIGEFLRLLVADAPLSAVGTRARELDLDLEEPRVAVLLRRAMPKERGRGAERDGRDVLARLVAACEAQRDAIVGRTEEGMLALLPREGHETVLDEIEGKFARYGWRAGVGGPAEDAASLRRSALEARRALELGTQLRRTAAVHRYEDLALHDVVDAGSARAQAFAQQTLGLLGRTGGRRIYHDTLRALSQHGFRVKSAAAALGVHPHTLSYRLKQIQRRFGFDLDDAQTRLRIELALLILDA